MRKILSYFRDSSNELKLVTWPKQEELIRATITTLVFVGITALVLGIMDFGLSKSYQLFLNF